MAQREFVITFTKRELASLFWSTAKEFLRDEDLARDPRAWAFVAWTWLRIRVGGL